jgi:mannose-1-phosphate guanylyltransferase/mannose-6-phosphate isomerase
VISHKTENSYVYAESGLVTTVGVKDLVVVQTKDAVLIADRNAVQDVKKVVEQIKADGRHEHHIHREVYRPWGKYDSIDAGDRYQVKRITVKPGEGLSVQMHHHRAEHWVVVAGTAKVTIDGEIKLLGENESIYIPLGATHCLENPCLSVSETRLRSRFFMVKKSVSTNLCDSVHINTTHLSLPLYFIQSNPNMNTCLVVNTCFNTLYNYLSA